MNINNINFSNVRFNYVSKLNSTPLKPETNKLERTPQMDMVSFSGNKKEKQSKLRIANATELYEKMIAKTQTGEMSLEDVGDIVREYSPNVIVRPMSELADLIPDSQFYSAFLHTPIQEDAIRPAERNMYIQIPSDLSDKKGTTIFAMSCAHEFTHVQQVDSLDAYKEIEQMANGDIDYAKALISFSTALFGVFDKEMQQKAIFPAFNNPQDFESFSKYNAIYPREQNVTKDMLAKGLGLKNEAQIKKYFNDNFDKYFDEYWRDNYQSMKEDGYLPDSETKPIFKEKIKECCKRLAFEEKEAYTTEAEIGRKALKTGRSLNIDALPLYYTMLEDALK